MGEQSGEARDEEERNRKDLPAEVRELLVDALQSHREVCFWRRGVWAREARMLSQRRRSLVRELSAVGGRRQTARSGGRTMRGFVGYKERREQSQAIRTGVEIEGIVGEPRRSVATDNRIVRDLKVEEGKSEQRAADGGRRECRRTHSAAPACGLATGSQPRPQARTFRRAEPDWWRHLCSDLPPASGRLRQCGACGRPVGDCG